LVIFYLVIYHAVGPRINQGGQITDADVKSLKECYTSSLNMLKDAQMRTIVFFINNFNLYEYYRHSLVYQLGSLVLIQLKQQNHLWRLL